MIPLHAEVQVDISTDNDNDGRFLSYFSSTRVLASRNRLVLAAQRLGVAPEEKIVCVRSTSESAPILSGAAETTTRIVLVPIKLCQCITFVDTDARAGVSAIGA